LVQEPGVQGYKGSGIVGPVEKDVLLIAAVTAAVAAAVSVLVSVPLQAALQGGWKRLRRHHQARKERRSQERTAAERARLDLDQNRRVERLEAERIGRTFTRRYTREDPGTLVRVIGLHGDQKVRVEEWAPAGREPTDFDPSELPMRYVTTWDALTRSPADQRHHTARLMELSIDDADGWLMIEPVGTSA